MIKNNNVGKIKENTDIMLALTKLSAFIILLQRRMNNLTKNYRSSFWVVNEEMNGIEAVYQAEDLTETEKKEYNSKSSERIFNYILDLEKKDIDYKDLHL